MTRTLVLIPSSRLVDSEMQLHVGLVPPVLVQIGGATVAEQILKDYAKWQGGAIDFACIVNEGAEQVREAFDHGPLRAFRLLKVDEAKTLADAIQAGLEQVDLDSYDSVIIHFGDTLVEPPAHPLGDVILYAELMESFRWTTFTRNHGRICATRDKNQAEYLALNHVFIGWFHISDPKEFLRELQVNQSSDRFYASLLKYLEPRRYTLEEARRWLDCGHSDNYHQATKTLINTRFFNQLQVHETKPLITKTSSNTARLHDEIRWYQALPRELLCFTPPIYDFSVSIEKISVTLEYYGYPTVGELYITGSRDLTVWSHLFSRLFSVLAEMRSYRLDASPEMRNKALHAMYCAKTRDRLLQLKSNNSFEPFFTGPIVINHVEYPGLNEILDSLEEGTRDLVDSSNSPFTIIHGDLCLSNMLYDPKTRAIKLVDPRGRFGDFTLYGDSRYDLAKLLHSFEGGYDFIISNRFHCLVDGSAIHYKIMKSPTQKQVSMMFEKHLTTQYRAEIPAARAIESLLFLSMIPLHSDRIDRQFVMLATGVERYCQQNSHLFGNLRKMRPQERRL